MPYSTWRNYGQSFTDEKRWRDDGKCGKYHSLPNGTPGQCDPDGDKPCCSSIWNGKCGNTAEHCSCYGNRCTDYRLIYKDWRESGGKKKWRFDGKCGRFYPLPDGTPGQCDPDGDKPCCSDHWSSVCGNTTERDCSCKWCTDYRNIYKDWRESGGKQKWRYDGKCGSDHPLPDGTPGQCDPDGDNPCCNDSYGVCGNTTEHCYCNRCTDYRIIYKDWRESGGKQKWRYDGKCGSDHPLPDGTPGQCDPDGDKPCCYRKTCVQASDETCFCTDCIDFRVLRAVRESGENCAVARFASGFLKNVCFNDSTSQFYLRCASSDVFYYHGHNDVSELCLNDAYAYQVCGLNLETQINNGFTLCGGYFCESSGEKGHRYIPCTGEGCRVDNRNCTSTSHNTDTELCDDKCDFLECRDELSCNGFQYGLVCRFVQSNLNHLHPSYICDGDVLCHDGADEKNCKVTENTVDTCTHYRIEVEENKPVPVAVPIMNFTRCSIFDFRKLVYPYCYDYLDQTNCSDIERVGGYCKVNGFVSSVSKYVVCLEYDDRAGVPVKICDDNFQNNCVSPSISDCRVHKHRMCDGVEDCSDGSDENHDTCEIMTFMLSFTCERTFQPKIGKNGIPVSWLMDNETDCMNGEDEDTTKWKFCPGKIKKFEMPGKGCQDVYKCRRSINKTHKSLLEKNQNDVDRLPRNSFYKTRLLGSTP